MQREIKIPYTNPNADARFVGRNGEFKQHGISLFFVGDGVCLIEAIRKNGQTARCLQSVPLEDMPALIAGLQALYDQHAPASTRTPQVEQPKEDGPKPLLIKVGRNYRLKNGYIAHIDGRDLVRNPAYPFFSKAAMDFIFWFAEDGSSRQYSGKIDVVEEVPTPKFEVGKKYVNRNLDVITITYISATNEGKALVLHGFNQNGVCENWRGDGQFAAWQTSVLDLVDEYHEQ